MNLTELSQKNFNTFRNRLINYSRRFNIPYEDIEEIVNDSIIKAIEHFDNEKGSFESLCFVIIKNKVFNFKRDNSFIYFLILLDEDEDVLKADVKSIEEKENSLIAMNFLNKLKNRLFEDELRLFDEIYNMCEASDKISISRASRNIGIKPAKGWDLFRKIQRKASSLSSKKDLVSEDSVMFKPHFDDEELVFNMEILDLDTEKKWELGLKKLFSSLSEDDFKKLNSIYNI